MSTSLLTNLSSALSGLLGWRVALLPGSFRGVPFYLNTARGTGGRRLVTHEFPLRDLPDVEDLGRKANVYHLEVFVVGDGYMGDRDALIAACQDDDTPGILVHPTQGVISCRAGPLEYSENPKELGGYCAFEIEFHRDAEQASLFGDDTASQWLGGIVSMISLGVRTYATVSAIAKDPSLLLGFAAGLLGEFGGVLLGLPAAAIVGIALAVGTITEAVLDSTATGNAVHAVAQDVAANVIAAQAPAAPATDPVTGSAPLIAPPADLSGGLAAMATWGDTLLPPTGAGAALASLQAQQAAVVALVEGAAALAVMTIYAGTDFTSSNAATAARQQVLAMVDRQATAANVAGNDDLYRGWLAIGALAMKDLIRRAQNLPALIPYATAVSRPSVVLAQLFYQDSTRADGIEILNDAPHPMFMPPSGVRLAA